MAHGSTSPVWDSVNTYRLRKDLLQEYLKSQFPKHKDFKINVSAIGRPGLSCSVLSLWGD